MKFLKIIWTIFFCCLFAAFILSCASAFLPTNVFLFSNIFAIAFPYIFTAIFIASVFHAFLYRKGWIFTFIIIALSTFNLSNLIGINRNAFQLQKKGEHCRILTWNVEMFTSSKVKKSGFVDTLSNPFSAYMSIVKTYNPDVICLQEYTQNKAFMDMLKKENYQYYYAAIDSILVEGKMMSRDFGVCVFSKYPLYNNVTTSYETSQLQSSMISADVMMHNKKINISTFHLFSFQISRDRQELQNKSNFIYTLKRLINISNDQTMQIKTYKQALEKAETPIVICSDLNNVPTSYIYHVAKKGMQDAYLKGAKGLGITFPNFLRTLRIDYILVDKKLKVMQSKIITAHVSDHFPVITDIVL